MRSPSVVRVHPSPLEWEEAREVAHRSAPSLAAQILPLDACSGTVLAAPLVARVPLPSFATSAMDGFAVSGSGPWSVVGDLRAGMCWEDSLVPGTALRIATGAPVPAGVTAVLPVEGAHLVGSRLSGRAEPGRHVRPVGEECAAGEELLPAGTPVRPAVLGLAAAVGLDVLEVHPRPCVRALVTGNELVGDGLPRPGRIRDAIGPQLAPLVRAHGGELVSSSWLPDDVDALHDAIRAADADLVLTTGASSIGPADHLREVLDSLGARVVVDGVRCRPGHPQLLAVLPDGRLVVGLPGNPLAALVAVVTVLAPALHGAAGRALPAPRRALLREGTRSPSDVTRLVPVTISGLHAQPVDHSGPAMLRGAARADALAVVPPGRALPVGADVEVLPLA